MGAMKKIKNSGVSNVIKHCFRQTNNNSNTLIDKKRSALNYSLINRDIAPYDYYKMRISQVPHVKRKDLVTLCTWCITAPETLDRNKVPIFFELVTSYIKEVYKEENVVFSVVNADESTPHVHIGIIPVSEKSGRICCNDVMTRGHLMQFHPRMRQYLEDHGLVADVMSGITKAQGGNIEVREYKKLKLNRTINREHEHTVTYDEIQIVR